MLSRDRLVVDIGSSYTKVLIGNKNRIKLYGMIKTPDNCFVGDNLISTEELVEAIRDFLKKNSVKPSDVSFAIHGQDIVVRHVEIPMMDEKGIQKAVEWEINQFLPENGTNYYIDYEIISKVNTKDKKTYNLLVSAAPKYKIDRYGELASGLGVKLSAIDMASNCAGRVFKNISNENTNVNSIGIIDIGFGNSNIIILDKGRLYIEREVPFGIKNAVQEIERRLGIGKEEASGYLFSKFDFDHISQDNEVDKGIQYLFDNALSSFEKVIQFYTTGKTDKRLDRIYLIGGGCEIPGIVGYIKDYFGSNVFIANSPEKINLRTKVPENFDFKLYVNAMGLLMRRENAGELNLIPYALKEKMRGVAGTGGRIATLAAILLILLGAIGYPMYLNQMLLNKESLLRSQVESNADVIRKSKELQGSISYYNSYISLVEKAAELRSSIGPSIRGLEKYTVGDIVFENLTLGGGVITVSAKAKKYNSITIFAANLQESKEYDNVSISGITYNEDGGDYSFSITMNY